MLHNLNERQVAFLLAALDHFTTGTHNCDLVVNDGELEALVAQLKAPAVEQTVYVVTEHEPECDYPFIIAGIFATAELAEAYRAAEAAQRDGKDSDKTEEDLWWEVEPTAVQTSLPTEAEAEDDGQDDPEEQNPEVCPDCGGRKGHTATCWLVDNGHTNYDRDGNERLLAAARSGE